MGISVLCTQRESKKTMSALGSRIQVPAFIWRIHINYDNTDRAMTRAYIMSWYTSYNLLADIFLMCISNNIIVELAVHCELV